MIAGENGTIEDTKMEKFSRYAMIMA